MDYSDYIGGRPGREWDDGWRSFSTRPPPASSRVTPPECQTVEALTTRCAILEDDLRRCMAQLSESRADALSLRADRVRLTSLELDNDALRRSCQEKETEYQELIARQEASDETKNKLHASAVAAMAHLHKQDSEVSQRRYAELEKKFTAQQKEESILRSDIEGWEDLHLTEVKKRKALQQEVDTLKEYQKIEGTRVRSLSSQLKAKDVEMTVLKSKIAELEETQPSLEPLAEIGAAIRTRFMHQARQMVTGEPSNRETIKRGNAAAHRADGRADAALLNGDYMTKADFSRMSSVFKNLYKQNPMDYGSWPQKILDAIDCEATIRTTLSIKRQLGSMPQRLQASEQMDELWRKFEALDFDTFEKNRDVQWRLDRLKLLTEEIVEAARLIR
ncbi:hypothetical protein PVAG01_09609 [Phlyctema vagabunda]|uniref:Uncharacterized protein n=1 Tax=Phlyctema vagabunda TaxID=108571 RepID=A0ABR4P7U2_9HELO